MLTHYATLTALAHWLNERIAGMEIGEAYTQSRNELVVSFTSAGKKPALRISVEPHRNFVYLVEDAHRAKRNSVDLFPAISGKTAQSFSAAVQDRVLFIHLPNHALVAIQMYGSSANVLLLDDSWNVVDAFVHARGLIGNRFTMSMPVLPEKILSAALPEFAAALRAASGPDLRRALKSIFPAAGKLVVDEILFRTGIGPSTTPDSLSNEMCELVRQVSKSVFDGLAVPRPRIYFRSRTPAAFSVILLTQFSDLRCEQYDSVNDAIRIYAAGTARDEHFGQEYKRLVQRIRTETAKVEKTMNAIRTDRANSDRAADYERFGKILLHHGDAIGKPGKTITLTDPVTNESVAIPLDPSLSASRNAARYFDRAKKAKSGRREAESRLESLEKKHAELTGMGETLERCSTEAELKEFHNAYRSRLLTYGMIEDEKSKPDVPFRIFHITGGFEVWAGKSSRNNDELTLHYAKPDDLWFHVRGSGGSHVILRVGTGNGEPSKEAKEEAAAIAAYYSKQKNAKYVPVAMAEKKYVRKPKGASPGSVIMEREKVLMVTPRLPSEEEK